MMLWKWGRHRAVPVWGLFLCLGFHGEMVEKGWCAGQRKIGLGTTPLTQQVLFGSHGWVSSAWLLCAPLASVQKAGLQPGGKG